LKSPSRDISRKAPYPRTQQRNVDGVEPRSCDHGHHKTGALILSTTLPTILIMRFVTITGTHFDRLSLYSCQSCTRANHARVNHVLVPIMSTLKRETVESIKAILRRFRKGIFRQPFWQLHKRS